MRVIGLDVHRSFAQVAVLEGTEIVKEKRLDLEHDAVVKFGRSLRSDDEVVLEATGNTAAIVRLLKPFVARVVIANALQVAYRTIHSSARRGVRPREHQNACAGERALPLRPRTSQGCVRHAWASARLPAGLAWAPDNARPPPAESAQLGRSPNICGTVPE